MSRTKKVSIAALVLFLVGGIGSVVTFNTINKPVSVSEEKIINEPITDIEIQADNEKVELVSSDEDNVKVELTGRSTEETKKQLNVDVEDGKLSIELKDEKFFNFQFFNFIGTSLTLKVSLPEEVYESLHVDIDNGGIHAEGLAIKNITVKVNNGKADMKNIHATKTNVETDNGKISLASIEGEINGEINNGKINLETSNLDRPITLKTDNGNILIKTEKEPANATLDIKTNNGKATVFGSSNWNTVIGSGDNLIKLTANNGKIQVTK